MAVIDASIVIGALSPDEQHPAALETLTPYFMGGGWVPSVWAIEVANVLLTKQRRRLLTDTISQAVWRVIMRIPIEFDAKPVDLIERDIMPLALAHQLSSYDACYLELALRRSLPIATLDRKLIAAARAIGVRTI